LAPGVEPVSTDACTIARMAETARAEAAHSGDCRHLAGRHPALRSNGLYVYAKRRHHSDIGKTFYVCTGHGNVRVLPGQDGGDTLFPGAFAARDNWLAYAVSQQEPAASTAPSYIYELKATTGHRSVTQAFAWPDENVQASVEVLEIVVAPNGSIAWLAHLTGHNAYAVERIGADGTRSTLASGQNFGRHSLTASPHGTSVSWIQNGQEASAPLA
jgi:hypothetical protein